MPIDYWLILKRSYQVTIRHPGLWLLGLLLAGGFNINFFYWANLRLRWRNSGDVVADWVQQNFHTSHIIPAFLLILAAAAFIIIVANWAKIIFVLYTSDILKLQRMRPARPAPAGPISALRESPRYLVSVTAMSVFTVIATGAVTTVLAGATQILFDSRGVVWLTAVLLLATFVFFFSCLNIFATFFVIFYRKRFAGALNLSLDLIVSRARVIVEMATLLLVIYGLCFFVGTSLLFLFKLSAVGLLTPLLQHGLVPQAAFFGLITGFSGLLLWVWLAIVNTFFNVSLLLLFTQLVRPPYHPEFKSLLEQIPAALPGQAAS
jgi:hypothetical protein